MRRFLIIPIFCLLVPLAPAQKKALTPDDIFVDGGTAGPLPQEEKWSPDGALYSYILRSPDGSKGDLWALDPTTGRTRILVDNAALARLNPSIDKTVTDEREKERLTRYSVAGYLWSPDSRTILFSGAGHLYLYDLAKKTARSFLPGLDGLKDPKFSPDGKWISFLNKSDIWIAPMAGGAPRQLTQGGSKNVLNGDLDWVYPEELDVRTGYHWSPDSRHIAFLQLDQTEVGETPIVDFIPKPHADVEMQKYPKAGQKNPKPRVGLTTLDGNQSWLDITAEYIPRIEWADAKTIAVRLLNRHQDELELVLWSVETRKAHHVLKEKEKQWVNVKNDLRFLPGDELLWGSERDGFNHLYIYRRDGKRVRQLTKGSWEVTALNSIDTKSGWVFFTATERSPIERHAYRIRLNGSGMEALTRDEGVHSINVDPSNSYYVDTASALLRPMQYSLVKVSDRSSTSFFNAKSVEDFDLIRPEIINLKAPDGAPIRVMILKPPEAAQASRQGAGTLATATKFPVLVYVYGGPHAPVITNAYGGERFLWHQWMARRGYVVVYIDDRTSAIPGHKYETALYKQFGFVELGDHREAIKYLKSLPYVDGDRIGLWGWSGGGYTTCFNMCNAGDIFKVGVAVAPLTDFEDYDTLWTERYMGLPQENRKVYEESSAPTHAAKLSGKLLLIHGTSDDNVHLQNSIQMAQKLIDAGKMFDIFIYPRKTHSISGTATRRHLYQKIADYFDQYLRR
ncbi:MAG TPA: DPP IV N-terminal domain-containing protein [Acidobacteriota bacterium]|jgi:dipeptidyl-peptidase-4|nr:DPP IV N-terminal domain-containing protein [Acidobacteriota bacterium]